MTFTRTDRDFEVEGDTCAAWLYLPEAAAAPPPVVVMAHGFSAERTFRLPAFAERFAAAGLAVLLFDYRCFGGSTGRPRFWVDPQRHLTDWRAAIAHARALPEVDGTRVALWGSSFSGGHVITIAAVDHGIAAIVAQVPYVGGIELDLPVSHKLRAGVSVLADLAVAPFGGAVRVPVVAPPGSFACMNAPEAMQFLDIVPPDSAWNNRVPARALATLDAYQPREVAPKVACPALVLVGEKDETTPAGLARDAAGQMPKGEVASFDAGHFEVYVPPLFDDVAACEASFLSRHLVA